MSRRRARAVRSRRRKVYRIRQLSLALVVFGVVLMGLYLVNGSLGAASGPDPDRFNVPEVNAERNAGANKGPSDRTLKVTIPEMSRVENATVPYTSGDNSEALRKNAAIHLKGTGSPWQKEANVYLAGHRLGYPSTGSFLAFYDLDKLQNGDEVYVEDATGERYTYRVFKEFVVSPADMWVTEPVPGKNILTLQSCTLPDYTQRLIVQAELVS